MCISLSLYRSFDVGVKGMNCTRNLDWGISRKITNIFNYYDCYLISTHLTTIYTHEPWMNSSNWCVSNVMSHIFFILIASSFSNTLRVIYYHYMNIYKAFPCNNVHGGNAIYCKMTVQDTVFFLRKCWKRGNVPGQGRGRKSKSLILGLQAYFNLSVWGLQWERDLKTFSQLKKLLRS